MHPIGNCYITVYKNSKNEFSYYSLSFIFKGYSDYLNIEFVMHMDSILKYGDDEYDDIFSCISEDSGTAFERIDYMSPEFVGKLTKLLPSKHEYFKPLPKYNKFKFSQTVFNEIRHYVSRHTLRDTPVIFSR